MSGAVQNAIEDARLQYEVERELAGRLKSAPADQRRALYPWVYQELFRRLPRHATLQKTPADVARDVAMQMAFLRRFLKPGIRMIEIGPGNCAVSYEAARRVASVVGVDVMEKATTGA